jgi:hypothetical protein
MIDIRISGQRAKIPINTGAPAASLVRSNRLAWRPPLRSCQTSEMAATKPSSQFEIRWRPGPKVSLW